MAERKRYFLTARSFLFAVAIHAAVAALLIFSFGSSVTKIASHPAAPTPMEPVKARVVTEEDMQRQLKAIEQKETQKKRKEDEARKRLEKILAETRRVEQKRKESEKVLKEAEAKKKQEQKEAQELAAKRKQEELKLAKLEQEKQREERAKAEAKKREEASRKAEETKRKAEEARREAERKKREAELQAQIEEERVAKVLDQALGQYIPIIRQKVSRNWNKPPNTPSGIEAKVEVRLTPTGEVVGVRVIQSSGDAIFDRSVENAVHKASPLPIPQERGVNERFRVLTLRFKPEDLVS